MTYTMSLIIEISNRACRLNSLKENGRNRVWWSWGRHQCFSPFHLQPPTPVERQGSLELYRRQKTMQEATISNTVASGPLWERISNLAEQKQPSHPYLLS